MASKQHEHGHGQVGQADQGNDPGDGALGGAVGQQDAINTGEGPQINDAQYNRNQREFVHHRSPSPEPGS